MKILILQGARLIHKRAALFIEASVKADHEIICVVIPRLKWDLSAYEDDLSKFQINFMSIKKKGGKFFLVPDLVICCHWILLPIAVIMKLIFGSKLMYDSHDYHAIMIRSIKGRRRGMISGAFIAIVNRLFLRFCDLITCCHLAGHIHLKELSKYSNNVLELNNYPTSSWQRKSVPNGNGKHPITFVYLGKVNEIKGCKLAVEAFLAARRKNPEFSAELHLIGSINETLVEQFEHSPNVFIRGKMLPREIKEFWEDRFCIGLLLYNGKEYYNYIGTNSRKMYEYLAAGVPIIASSLGEITDFVKKHDVGYLVEANIDHSKLTNVFLSIAANPDEARRKAMNAVIVIMNNQMNWENEWKKVLKTRIFSG